MTRIPNVVLLFRSDADDPRWEASHPRSRRPLGFRQSSPLRLLQCHQHSALIVVRGSCVLGRLVSAPSFAVLISAISLMFFQERMLALSQMVMSLVMKMRPYLMTMSFT